MSQPQRPRQKEQKQLQKVKGSMISVKVIDNNIESALRLFKKKIKESNVLEDYKNVQYYVKPSEKRRSKHDAAVRKQQKENRQNQ